jgi:hypothetical protein
VRSTPLPRSGLYNQIAVTPGGLILSGELASTASSEQPTCASATVNPQTLAVHPTSPINCNDPSVQGESVGVVNGNIDRSLDATIRIARVVPHSDRTVIGPVVMRYASLSDTRPVIAYGGPWLWIYDDDTVTDAAVADNSRSGTAELLQVSTSSGKVVDTISVPDLSRPLLAADRTGAWIGNSVEGSICSGCAPPSALYFVAPGSHQTQLAISSTTSVVCWVLGSDESLWLGIGTQATGCSQQAIWRLDGTDFQPMLDVRDRGYRPNSVVGDQSDGLWTLQWTLPPVGTAPRSSPQEIVGINPDTGAERVAATLPARAVPLSGASAGLLQGQAVVADGALYLLEPPFEQRGYLGYSSLIRVTLPTG